jgi:hypothetical protein
MTELAAAGNLITHDAESAFSFGILDHSSL